MSWSLRVKCSSIYHTVILCTAKTSPVSELPGNMTIMELALVVSLGNVDYLLQLDLRAFHSVPEDRFAELVLSRRTYYSWCAWLAFASC